MTCPTCHKPTPPDSVHTCSPVPLLTMEDVQRLFELWPQFDGVTDALFHIATGRVACHDTQAGVFVPFMTEVEAREKFEQWADPHVGTVENRVQWFAYLAALRLVNAIKEDGK